MIKNPHYLYGPPVNVPVKLNFGDFILKKLLEFDQKVAIINGATHEVSTFRGIAQCAMNLAVSLTRIGVRKGDIVAICSENQQDFLPAVIGIVCTGAIVTTINVGYTKGEFEHVMSISKPKYIFCSQLFYDKYEKTIRSLAHIKQIILFGVKKQSNALMYNELIKASTNNKNGLTRDVSYSEFETVDVEGQIDTLFILYSSGTTGLPKGVMLTHLNLLTLCCAHLMQEEEMVLTVAPWYHVMGLVGALRWLALGWSTAYVAKFELNLYLDTVQRYKITQLTVVPPVLIAICKTRTQHDLTSVRIVYSGAAPLYRDTVESVRERIPNLKAVLQGYGMTECTLAVTRDTGDVSKTKPGGCGPVFPGLVVKVADVETGQALGPHKHGEICIKGGMVMKGYVGKDKNEGFDDEGFFKTGDIGYYDDDKYFFIVDRLKELIKYKGYQVPPAEIEAILLQHESVKDVGVVGIDHKAAGEVPLAFVVTQPGKKVSEEELKQFVAERLSNPKHLRGGVRFISEIPKNPSGKILRRELKKIAKSGKSKL